MNYVWGYTLIGDYPERACQSPSQNKVSMLNSDLVKIKLLSVLGALTMLLKDNPVERRYIYARI